MQLQNLTEYKYDLSPKKFIHAQWSIDLPKIFIFTLYTPSINKYKHVQLTKKQSMTMATMEETLDALASVLLSYLDQVSETLAMGVEASGQSGVHCNILDCLHAVEQCTVPAVQHVHMDVLLNSDGSDDNNNNNPNNTPTVTNSNTTTQIAITTSTFAVNELMMTTTPKTMMTTTTTTRNQTTTMTGITTTQPFLQHCFLIYPFKSHHHHHNL